MVFSLSIFGQGELMVSDSIDNSTQYLVRNSTIKTFGVYVGNDIGNNRFGGSSTPFSSLSLNLLLNQKLSLGAVLNSQLNRNYTPLGISSSGTIRTRLDMAGLKIGYSFSPRKLINFTFPVQVGVGAMQVDSTSNINNSYRGHRKYFGWRSRKDVTFGFVTPGIEVNLNVFKYGIIYLGSNYRIATNVSNDTGIAYVVKASDINGLSLFAGVKVGIFELWKRKLK
jgi:hypothetical protein